MSKLTEFATKVKEKLKSAAKKFPFIPVFIGGMMAVIVAAHFVMRPTPVVEQTKPEVVAAAPAPTPDVRPPVYVQPAPEVKVYQVRVPAQAGAQDQRPIVVEIHQTTPAPAVPEVAPTPKEIPEHLKLTPENLSRLQPKTGSTDEFDVDFDFEPEKETKK